MRTADGQADMTKLIGEFSNFANAPKINVRFLVPNFVAMRLL